MPISDDITEQERYPTLTDAGRAMLTFLREHPNAPIYRNISGNHLTADEVEQVRAFEREAQTAPVGWQPGGHPIWLDDFAQRCFTDVPFYRAYGARPRFFEDIPTLTRADLSRNYPYLVPDGLPLDRLIGFLTTGTSGHALQIASYPPVAASYLAFFKRALARVGITLTHGRGQVGVALVGWQKKCWTYVSVTPTMDESGLAKINLHPNDWRDPADRAKYLDALNAEVYTGDPISFAELATLPLTTRPKAMLSTSMALLPGMKRDLERHFGCPVIDMYSMNETGPIAAGEPTGHALLQPRLFVEILGADGAPLPPGARGEITLTGGFNPYLPLLRYRTGDFAALRFDGIQPMLVGLEGRPPTLYQTTSGEWINNIDVTHALQPFALPQFALHQFADGAVRFRARFGMADQSQVKAALLALFGSDQRITIEPLVNDGEKVIQYTRENAEA